MKYLVVIGVTSLAIGLGLIFGFLYFQNLSITNPLGKNDVYKKERPLNKYSFKNLRKADIKSSDLTLGEKINETEDFTSYVFYFRDTFSDPSSSVSGLINIPVSSASAAPIMIMYRGYVDRGNFITGEGTRRTAEEFAKNGFITLAPDYLGYGESDWPSELPLEERFQTYTTSISLLNSLVNLQKMLDKNNIPLKADTSKIGFWAHSNGGQIALSVLAITGKNIPTVLWAPVTKPFPYNILYFTDEYDDEGKALRKVVADFEKDYNVYDFSFTRYMDWIKAPIQLHQGGSDEAVPQRWSDQFVEILNDKKIDNDYYVYPGENHNFQLGSWPTAVGRSIEFIKNKLNNEN